MDHLVARDIEYYAERHTSPESALLKELVAVSSEKLQYTDMISGRVVGRLLAMMVRLTSAQRILEVGTFTGYSALSMAEALPDEGRLITCDYNERYEKIARSFFKKSNHGYKISLHMGPALETIKKLDGSFDLVFLDADKNNYPDYYTLILPKLQKGGVMIIDNVLWDGEVLNPADDKSRAIDKLNKMIREDERVEHVLLTVRDGLQLVRKK